jgi:hypothetical protein
MTYSELISAVKEWSQRKNISDSTISIFLEAALSRANWALRVPPLETFYEAEINEGGYFEVPGDFLEMKTVSYISGDTATILDRKTISEVDSLANYNDTSDGTPKIFGRAGEYFRLAPWSGEVGERVTLYYYAALPPLNEGNPTNWFSEFAPTVLIYGALSELSDYSRDTEGSQLWKARFTEEVNILQAVEDKAQWTGSTLAITPTGSIIGRK